MNNIKFVALGGMDENGKNIFAIEINNSIFVMDGGNKNPSFHSFGIDMIIPGFTYLEKNRNKIKGVFITNGHSYNIGALSYLVKSIPNLTIYSSPLTKSAIENEFRKMRVKNSKLSSIQPGGELKIENFTIKTFQLTSEQPQSLGFAIVNANQQVVYAVDYFLGESIENNLYKTQMNVVKEIAKSAETKLLITDAMNCRQEGKGEFGNTGYINGFKNALSENNQKLLVGAFTENFKAIQEMIEFAVEKNKKIVIYGRALNEQIKTLKAKQLINLPDRLLISFKKLENEKNCVIFASHTFYQLYRKLSNIANKKDEYIKISNEFDVYIAATPIPGAETFYYKILDDFYKEGIRATSINKSFAKESHPFEEDIKEMINIFKPENIIPVKGYFRDFIKLQDIAKETGINTNHTALLDNGEMVEVTSKGVKKLKSKVECVEKFVDGLGVGDVGHAIVYERNIMGESGLILIGILINEKTKALIQKPEMRILGLTDDQELLELLSVKLDEVMEEFIPSNNEEAKKFKMRETKNIIRKKILNFCRRKMNKEPAVVPVIIETR